MKLNIHQDPTKKHGDCVAAVGWTGNSELFSCGDDRKILRWSTDGELLGALQTVLFDAPKSTTTAPNSTALATSPAALSNQTASSSPNSTTSPSLNNAAADAMYVTELHWFPALPGKAQTTAEVFVVGGTDGKFYICTRAGRVEKGVEAHKGAILAVKWNYEGSALLTAGEDGQVKIWSRAGMLRSSLIQMGYPIYSACWSPENDKVLITNGRNLVIKPIQAGTKPNQWKAHDGTILKVDWNLSNNLILSGSEDRKYKIWDTYGRQLFASSHPHDHPITCISWSPSGNRFAVGSFNFIRICDRLGWSYAVSEPDSGSIMNISWTPDGTQLACAGGNGAVVIASLLNRRIEWKNYEVTFVSDHRIRVHDVMQGSAENLEFRDRVIKASLSFGYLIVCTASQCYIYSEKNWNTPNIVDLVAGGRVVCIKQCSEYFVIVDTIQGIQIFTYESRLVSSPKYPGLRPEYLTQQSLSISSDTLAIKDRTDEKAVYLFDVHTGKPLSTIENGMFRHYIDVVDVALNQSSSKGPNAGGGASGRQMVIVDKNRDMWLIGLIKFQPKKLGSMIDTFAWNDEIDMIAAMSDGKFVVWYYPNAVFVDEDVAAMTKFEKDGSLFGRDAQFVHFLGTECTLRRADGALVTASSISPFPAVLHEQTRKKQWEEAIRLCRYSKMDELWACLAAMAVFGQDLNTAEVAYAMIHEPAKVQYICYIRDLPTPESRAAELALFRRQPREAENILLQAGQVYRAIMMWINVFQWERALDIATKYKAHADMVIYFRDKYLQTIGRKENNKRFIQVGQGMEIDPERIKETMQAEEAKSRKAH